jgi:hypothetical protein
MRVQRGVGGVSSLIFRGVGVYFGFGHVGYRERPWLAEWGGGESERCPGGMPYSRSIRERGRRAAAKGYK